MADPSPPAPPARPGEEVTPCHAAVAEMLEHARSMRASATTMVEQVAACTRAAAGMQRQIEDVKATADKARDDLQGMQLDPARNPAPRIELAPVTDAAKSMRAIAIAVGVEGAERREVGSDVPPPPPLATSMHAVALAVPKAKKENRWLTILTGVLVIVANVVLKHFWP